MADSDLDDLDDLINDVGAMLSDAKPSKGNAKAKAMDKKPNPGPAKGKKPSLVSAEDLDDLLGELQSPLDDDAMALRPPPAADTGGSSKSWAEQQASSSAPAGGAARSASSTREKCSPLCLAGCDTRMGLSTKSSKKACDNLRCLKCDFKVAWFDNYVWDESVDYLFFRNGCTEFDKLKSKLNKRKGHRSYCCQCLSAATGESVEIKKIAELHRKWACGKHR